MNRAECLAQARSIVVKVGSAVLTTADGLHLPTLNTLVEQIVRLHRSGHRVTLVSSGAVAAGRTALKDFGQELDLSRKYAAAAIGQGRLMRAYEDSFAAHGLLCAQVLLTRDDLRSRARFLNARYIFTALLDWHVVPIVNENDTVVVQDLKFGDNDALSSLLLNLVEGDLSINLTSTPGVLSRNPLTAAAGEPIPLLSHIGDIESLDLDALCGGKTSVGTGGMYSKLLAARRAAQLGVPTLIAPGREPDILDRIFAGEDIGTWVQESIKHVSRRKYWLIYQSDPQGEVRIDQGAATALLESGKSLLPVGVRDVNGSFGTGAVIRILDLEGHQLGVGLSNYPDEALRKIMGRKRHEIAAILGDAHYPEVIHRDNMLLNAAV